MLRPSTKMYLATGKIRGEMQTVEFYTKYKNMECRLSIIFKATLCKKQNKTCQTNFIHHVPLPGPCMSRHIRTQQARLHKRAPNQSGACPPWPTRKIYRLQNYCDVQFSSRFWEWSCSLAGWYPYVI